MMSFAVAFDVVKTAQTTGVKAALGTKESQVRIGAYKAKRL